VQLRNTVLKLGKPVASNRPVNVTKFVAEKKFDAFVIATNKNAA